MDRSNCESSTRSASKNGPASRGGLVWHPPTNSNSSNVIQHNRLIRKDFYHDPKKIHPNCARLRIDDSFVILSRLELFYLCTFAFVAGLVDSLVGGGGLIQLPALFLFLPANAASSIPLVLGTNKLAAVCGTGTA